MAATAAPPAPSSPVSPPAAAAEAAPPRRWRLRDAAGSLGTFLSTYGSEGVGLLVPTLGGAVDIVVVRQPDGSLKSSPFYVRFGKYQGVLRSRYKRVEVWANGQKTPLFMHLGRTGEAFFGDEALLRDEGDAEAPAEPRTDAGAPCVAVGQDVPTQPTDSGGTAPAAPEGAEAEELMFATELEGGEAEPLSAARRSLLSRLGALTGGARSAGRAASEDGEDESEGEAEEGCDVAEGSVLATSAGSEAAGRARRWAFWRSSGGGEHAAVTAVPPRPIAARPLTLPRIDSALSDVFATPRGAAGDDAAAGSAAEWAEPIWTDGCDADGGFTMPSMPTSEAEAAAEAALASARAQLAPGCAELSLCGDNAAPGAFEAAAVSRDAFVAGGEALLADPRLRLRLSGGAPAPLRKALPGLLSLLAFGVPMPAPAPAPAPAAARAGEAAAAAAPADAAAAPSARRPRRLRPTAEEIVALGLRDGRNIVTFVVNSSVWGRLEVNAQVFVWEHSAKVVISDIDGTITKSDLMGHVMPILGRDWAHDGVAALYNAIAANGYQLAFLSARSVGQADTTRSYLRGLQARPGGELADGVPLAPGPVILAPDGITTALVRELIRRAPAEFKIACLTDIRALFPPEWNPFYAGFGNRGSDVISYAAVGVPRGRTFTINPRGELACEALHHTRRFTLPTLAAMLDEFFPPVAAGGGGAGSSYGRSHAGGDAGAFGDVAFWRAPPALLADDDPTLAALAAQAAPALGRSAPK